MARPTLQQLFSDEKVPEISHLFAWINLQGVYIYILENSTFWISAVQVRAFLK